MGVALVGFTLLCTAACVSNVSRVPPNQRINPSEELDWAVYKAEQLHEVIIAGDMSSADRLSTEIVQQLNYISLAWKDGEADVFSVDGAVKHSVSAKDTIKAGLEASQIARDLKELLSEEKHFQSREKQQQIIDMAKGLISALGYAREKSELLSGKISIPIATIANKKTTIRNDTFPSSAILLVKGSPRNEDTCRIFFDLYLYETSFDDESNSLNKTPVYWLHNAVAESSIEKKCQNLLENYDYKRALVLMSEANLLGREGPFLVGYPTGSEESLVFDLSSFANADLRRAMLIWQKRILQNPRNWSNGFRFEIVREEFRNLLQLYGDKIISLISYKKK